MVQATDRPSALQSVDNDDPRAQMTRAGPSHLKPSSQARREGGRQNALPSPVVSVPNATIDEIAKQTAEVTEDGVVAMVIDIADFEDEKATVQDAVRAWLQYEASNGEKIAGTLLKARAKTTSLKDRIVGCCLGIQSSVAQLRKHPPCSARDEALQVIESLQMKDEEILQFLIDLENTTLTPLEQSTTIQESNSGIRRNDILNLLSKLNTASAARVTPTVVPTGRCHDSIVFVITVVLALSILLCSVFLVNYFYFYFKFFNCRGNVFDTATLQIQV